MKQNGIFKRALALLLALTTLLSLLTVGASAASIEDGSKTAAMTLGPGHHYLTTTAGTSLGAWAYSYATNDGITGVAYCINHGLHFTAKTLPITGKYTASPKTAGVFANGYPQHSLDIFLGRYLADNAILSGLTEAEYAYATQCAVWATLGQLGIDGTAFTAGREKVNQPTGDVQQARVFRAIQLLLQVANSWDRLYTTGMYIRVKENALGGNVAVAPDMTLDYAANNEQYGFKREVIGGVSYYTHEYIFASATSTYYDDYNIELWADNAPAGMIFTDLDNNELAHGTFKEKTTWSLPTVTHATTVNSNGYEYWGKAKLCLPVETTPNSGEITLHCGSYVMQYNIYLCENTTSTEQSYIIADPSKGTVTADAVLKWGGPITEKGELEVLKVDGNGNPLSGAEFTLRGSDGSTRTGVSDENGKVHWAGLDPAVTYTLVETEAPAGYAIVNPINVTIQAARTNYVTVPNTTVKHLIVRKIDKQNGYTLQGVGICFKQIDGSFKTVAYTDAAGIIQLDADQLPVGSYKVYEVSTIPGYLLDDTPQTVNWDGKRDAELLFKNVRDTTLIIYKKDQENGYGLSDCSLEVYLNGQYFTTVTTNQEGLAYVHGLSKGQVTVKEVIAPSGYVLSDKEYSIYIDSYNPATTDDPRLVIPNEAQPQLRIIKLDRSSRNRLEGYTFEIWHDSVSLGDFITDAQGEIHVADGPGTYLVQEKETGDPSHIIDPNPQQIKLVAGDKTTRELVFFNDLRPGMHLIKLDSSDLKTAIPNARFRFETTDGSWGPQERRTGADGTIDLSDMPVNTALVVTELECAGYVVDDAQRIIQLKPNQDFEFVFTDSKLPKLKLTKLSSDGSVLPGVTYSLTRIEDGARSMEQQTSTAGEATWDDLQPGIYSLKEIATDVRHILDPREYHIELVAGRDSTIVLQNDVRPNLYIHKKDAISGAPIKDCVYLVKAADGRTLAEAKTDETGTAVVRNLLPQVVEVVEKSVPEPYLLSKQSRLTTLWANHDADVYFEDYEKPTIIVRKVNSVTDELIETPAKFHVVYKSNDTDTGEINDLGYRYTEHGVFTLEHEKDGWYTVTEIDPPTGFAREETPQQFYLKAGESKTITVKNTPLSAIVVWKFDSETGAALSGCRFDLKYLSGESSGTGGTVVAKGVTGANGSITFTGIKKGVYQVEELSSDANHVISEAPQTVNVSGNDQDVVEVFVGNAPKGGVLIRKTDGDGKPLSGCEFLVTDSSGAVIGDANGKYVTGTDGTALIDGLDPGTTIIIKETKAKDDSYVLDNVAQTVRIKPGRTIPVDFVNYKKGNLLILKQSSVDKKTPISGALFELRYADGRYVDAANGKLSSNGQYYTDSEGKILMTGICGTVVATELASAPGYSIDESTRTQTVVVRPDDTQTLRFFNVPWQKIIIQKYADDGKKTPLAGVTFLLTDGNGAPIGGGSGEYTTNSAGQIVISAPVGTTIKAREIKTVKGYALNTEVQTITVQGGGTAQTVIAGVVGSTSSGATVINSGDGSGSQMNFYNKTLGKVELVKTDALDKTKRLADATYEIRQMNQGIVKTVTTGKDGRVVAELGEGDFYAVEIEAPKGYQIDPTPHYFTVKDGETTPLPLTDKAICGIEIHKVSSLDGSGIYQAKFLVYDANNKVVGELTTDDRGYARIEVDAGRYRLRELECEGYVVDTKLRDIVVESGKVAIVEWENTPQSGQIMVTKYAAEANSVTGQAAGTPLQGATYEIVNPRNNAVIANITTDARGVAASKPLPLGRYQVREVSSPAYWQVSSQVFDITLEYAGQIIKLAAYDKPSELGVVLTKTGIKEVLAGNRMAYTFTVANTSNVPLQEFYFHDKLPYDVTSATALTTGTYNQRLSYRILYKTNVNGYRVLASNLLTSNNYAFQLSGLQLMAGEVVTDILYDFGKVPAGFQSVAKPTLTVSVNPSAVNGYQVINRADAGGQYGGTWQTANASWITIVVNLKKTTPTPLPKTGY